MKKTYIIPTTQMVAVQQQAIIALSTPYDPNKTVQGNDDIGVKGDRVSRETYNVWNDDWSK